ncbi:hypothetical protein BVZ80_02008B, partial [Haemophilus influenzae]
MGFII